MWHSTNAGVPESASDLVNASVTAALRADTAETWERRLVAAARGQRGVRGLQRGGDYTYFCSFPGHWNVMRGKLVVE